MKKKYEKPLVEVIECKLDNSIVKLSNWKAEGENSPSIPIEEGKQLLT